MCFILRNEPFNVDLRFTVKGRVHVGSFLILRINLTSKYDIEGKVGPKYEEGYI